MGDVVKHPNWSDPTSLGKYLTVITSFGAFSGSLSEWKDTYIRLNDVCVRPAASIAKPIYIGFADIRQAHILAIAECFEASESFKEDYFPD